MRQSRRAKIGVLLVLIIGALFFVAESARAISIATVPVGDVGNSNDPATGNLYGGVNYVFNIGLTEVTIGQYTAFLNAVAATDSYGLYDTSMAGNVAIAGIARQGSNGSYSYSVIGSPNRPITYVDWGDAARFANWINNGQPAGAQDESTTEDGAYTLNGATITALATVSRNPGAKWFLPNENEWYKAAYHQPESQGGDGDSYWKFPMKTNNAPYSDQPPGATPDNSRAANFYQNDGIANGYNDGYALSGSTGIPINQNYLTEVGAYTASVSYYGTYDQAGSVLEWDESKPIANTTSRVLRGGSWGGTPSNPHPDESLSATARGGNVAWGANLEIGFRVASSSSAAGALGDFDGNGTVDTADYLLWRRSNGSTADYKLWRAHFGHSIGGSGSSIEFAAVPEPSVLLLLAISVISMLCYRKAKS